MQIIVKIMLLEERFSVLCENPTFIINRRVISLFYNSKCQIISNYGKEIHSLNSLYKLLYAYKDSNGFNRVRLRKQLLDYRCIDELNYSHPVFVEVGCGHCLLCRTKKVSNWSQRVLAECQSHDVLPRFVTLTYNDSHLPSDGVSIVEIRKYMQTIRDTFRNRFNYDFNIRYFACGEYGSKTHRPHYHLIIWGLPSYSWYVNNISNCSYFVFNNIIDDLLHQSWCVRSRGRYSSPVSKGFTFTEHVSDAKGCAFYVAKYLQKQSFTSFNSKDLNPPFLTASRGHGGIGSQYYKEHPIPQPFIDYQFIDKFNNKIYFRTMNQFVKKINNGTLLDCYGKDYARLLRKCLILNAVLDKDYGMYDPHTLVDTFDPYGFISPVVNPDTDMFKKYDNMDKSKVFNLLNSSLKFLSSSKIAFDKLTTNLVAWLSNQDKVNNLYFQKFSEIDYSIDDIYKLALDKSKDIQLSKNREIF